MKLTLDQAHDYWKEPDNTNNAPDYLKPVVRSKYLSGLFRQANIRPTMSILELGCNSGRNLNYFHHLGFNRLQGIDISQQAINCNPLYEVKRNCSCLSIEDYYSLDNAPIDVIFSMAVLMHLHPDSEWVFEKIVEQVHRWLVVVEYEGGQKMDRCWSRDYGNIFNQFGMRILHQEIITGVSGLNNYTGYLFYK